MITNVACNPRKDCVYFTLCVVIKIDGRTRVPCLALQWCQGAHDFSFEQWQNVIIIFELFLHRTHFLARNPEEISVAKKVFNVF